MQVDLGIALEGFFFENVNGSLSLSTILYICQPHSTLLQKATLLLLHLIRLKGTFCSTGKLENTLIRSKKEFMFMYV